MKLRIGLLISALAFLSLVTACDPGAPTNSPSAPPNTVAPSKVAGVLADSGFKAEITIAEPPTKLRVGQKEIITIKVKNISDVIWYARGGEINNRQDNTFYIAAGNHWLDKDGKLTTAEEGHSGIPKDLKPGEDTAVTLQITAPKTPGEYILDLDMVQEGVAWFREKGSTTTKVPVTVVK
jgi:hypothetical protein